MPRMRQYEKLSDNDRDSRRIVADAVEVLRKNAGFTEHDCAKIRVPLLRLPLGESVGFVEVLFDAPWVDMGYSVSLRTAARFRGRRQDSTHYEEFAIIRLNRAGVNFAGTVVLADGTVLYAVEVLTAPMMAKPSEFDWRIVHAALKIIDGGDSCYRSLREGVPFSRPDAVPDERFLDCSELSKLKPPPLKAIVQGIASVDPTLDVSAQKIADALRKFGVRLPSPRPRRNEDRIPLG